METEKKLLEVGDVVFRKSYNYPTLHKTKVTKTTPKQAIVDGKKVKREYEAGEYKRLKTIGDKWGSSVYLVYCETLEREYQLQETRKEVKHLLIQSSNNLKTLTLPQLLSIKSILSGEEKVVEKKEVVGWVLFKDIDMEVEANWRKEYLGRDKDGMMIRGYYACIRDKHILENEEEFIYPTHLIPISSLLNLPTKD